MNNKAFTLVEIIGVVAILALMFLVAYPSIVSLSKNEDNKKYELMVKDICLAGESYIYATNIAIKPGSTIPITIEDLKNNGYIDAHLKDAKTNQEISASKTILYRVNNDNTLECTYE